MMSSYTISLVDVWQPQLSTLREVERVPLTHLLVVQQLYQRAADNAFNIIVTS